jgi:hypothetical protein
MAEGFGLYGALAGRRGHLEFVNLARHRVPSHSARALAASERLSASVCFRAVTGRPSRQLPRLGCANSGPCKVPHSTHERSCPLHCGIRSAHSVWRAAGSDRLFIIAEAAPLIGSR